MSELFEKLCEKLSDSNIKFEIEDIKSEEYDDLKRIKIEIPMARESQTIILSAKNPSIEQMVNCDFNKFKFIKGFEAIWSSEKKHIECELEYNGYYSDVLEKLMLLIEKSDSSTADNESREEVSVDEEFSTSKKEVREVYLPNIKDIEVSIGYCSDEFLVLCGLKSFLTISDYRRNRRFVTLKIKNIDIKTHDEAKSKLQTIANSILFQLDTLIERPFVLKEERESFRERRKEFLEYRQSLKQENRKFSDIKYEYDVEPATMYLYAKASLNMPLYKFLAFYQSIEFYFPIYSNIEAKSKIKRLLKDPNFDPELDQNITKLMSLIKYNRSNEIGDERSQLKSTMLSCIDPDDLRDFLCSNEKRKEFYERNLGKCLSKHNVSVANKNANILLEVSERIYDIRCRIVHKKADDNNYDIILPFSQEVKVIKHDLELVEYVARCILIERSRPIRI